MYAAVRNYTLTPESQMEQIIQEVRMGLGPLLSHASGFVAYYVIDTGNHTLVAISIFETQVAADKSDETVAHWIMQRLGTVVATRPIVMEGQVVAYANL